jgi:L-aspartate oxidase
MKTDFLIIGSGIAGLSLALKLSKMGKVLILTKKQKFETNTNYAQGGIAAVLGNDDNFNIHIKDTIECGAGLCNIKAVEFIVRQGPERIKELINLGVKFSKEKGILNLGREGGHSRRRIAHSKDLTGKVIEKALLCNISINKKIKLLEYSFAIDILTDLNLKKNLGISYSSKYGYIPKYKKFNQCYGVYALNNFTGTVEKIVAKKTIIATGGLGQVYLHTTNPSIATGDGFAMGYRAGCEIANMEFVQFHPTTLHSGNVDNEERVFLISEAVRGAGAILKTKNGKEFMQKYDSRKSLAPRDIVARAIDSEMKQHGDNFVYLDLRPIGKNKIVEEFPNIYSVCKKYGFDVTKEMIPVVPAAHYSCGGIKTDLNGKTSVKNLYACGEVAMTGVHGANRLASNSLLEAVAFSQKIFEDILQKVKNEKADDLDKTDESILNWNDEGTENNEEWILISHNKREIKEIMNDYVGIVRNTYRLERAYRRIKMMKDEIKEFYNKTKVTVELLELRNLVTVAYLIIKSAMKRKESRGLHYMLDFPYRLDNKFKNDTVIQKTINII